MASLAMSPQQQETTSNAISGATDGANTLAIRGNQLWGNLRTEMGNVTKQMKEKRAEFEQTKENLRARVNETKENAKRTIEQKQADLEEYKAGNAAIQAQGQHAYLSHGWSGLKKKAAEAKQKAIEAKEKLKKDKVIFDKAKEAAHTKAVTNFNELPDVQLGQKTSDGTGQAGTSLSGKSFELGGGRRRRRRRKSRRKKKSKKKRGRKSRKKKRRKTRKRRRRKRGGHCGCAMSRKKSRRRRRR